jgi:hypothetical protein
MTVLSRPYSKSGVVDADVFASFTEHTHSSRLLLLNGVKVCGVWYIDSMTALCSGYGPSIMMDGVGHPYGLLLNASNTECVGMILSRLAFEWIPVLAPRREKPPWAVSASSGAVDATLLTEAGIDPLPAVSTNLSLFLVPTICPFTFKLPTLNNLGPEDMSKFAAAHGSDVVEWAQLVLNYGAQGENAIALYNHLEANDLLVRHLGARADDLSLHTNKHAPCLLVVPCTSCSHPDDYRTLLSRLGGAATAAAIPPPALAPQQFIITSNEETKEKNTMAVGYHTLLIIMICAKYDPDNDALSLAVAVTRCPLPWRSRFRRRTLPLRSRRALAVHRRCGAVTPFIAVDFITRSRRAVHRRGAVPSHRGAVARSLSIAVEEPADLTLKQDFANV